VNASCRSGDMRFVAKKSRPRVQFPPSFAGYNPFERALLDELSRASALNAPGEMHALVCPDCGNLNKFRLGKEPPPASCSQCGQLLLKSAASPSAGRAE
jgi:ribosomal protein S27E